jgi:hypothetical protein
LTRVRDPHGTLTVECHAEWRLQQLVRAVTVPVDRRDDFDGIALRLRRRGRVRPEQPEQQDEECDRGDAEHPQHDDQQLATGIVLPPLIRLLFLLDLLCRCHL